MPQEMRKMSLWNRFLETIDRVTPVRFVLILAAGALIVVHGIWPKSFVVDQMTLGLLTVAAVLALVPLLKSATFPGGTGVQFREELDHLKDASARAVIDQALADPPVVKATSVEALTIEQSALQAAEGTITEILREAARSPRIGLVMLSGELEASVRQLLAMTGWETPASARSVSMGVRRLVEVGVLTESAASALALFMTVRNEIVHGRTRASDDEVVRAIDAGVSLLRAITVIPRERNVIEHENVPIFSDPEGTIPVSFGHGVIMRTHTPGGRTSTLRIYPTTRTDHEVGREVTWEWDLGHRWGETWYGDPASGEIKSAWTASAEFRGRHLD